MSNTETKCPYKNIMDKSSFLGGKTDKVEENDKSKCPFFNKQAAEEQKTTESSKNKENKHENNKKIEEHDISSDEDQKTGGGCPVLNKVKKDPINKHFEPAYEIRRFGPFDFIFELRGILNSQDYNEQTKIISSYPRHMKYTLFHNDDKIKMVRTKEFPMVFFVYDDVKEKGNKLYKKKKYREAIDYYIYAYSMLKWIEFKDPKKQSDFLKVPSLDPVLDCEIKEMKAYLDNVEVEEDSYKACVVYLLMCLSNTYMELRHHSEAIACLNECLTYSGDKVPDVYFRRSQARGLNKYSTEEEILLSIEDAKKAISLKKEKIYEEHLDKLKTILEDKKKEFANKTEKMIDSCKYSVDKIKERKLSINDYLFHTYSDQKTQYNVLKEMRNKYVLAIKFFTETKNEEQLTIAYKEIEAFTETYNNFCFYYFFDPENINPKYLNLLSDQKKKLIKR